LIVLWFNNLIFRVMEVIMILVDMFVSLIIGIGVVALLFLCGVFVLYLLLIAFLRRNWRVLKKVGSVAVGHNFSLSYKPVKSGCEGCVIEFSCVDKDAECLTRDRKNGVKDGEARML
jgi:hypothetical protein